jgi:hypothetical protein
MFRAAVWGLVELRIQWTGALDGSMIWRSGDLLHAFRRKANVVPVFPVLWFETGICRHDSSGGGQGTACGEPMDLTSSQSSGSLNHSTRLASFRVRLSLPLVVLPPVALVSAHPAVHGAQKKANEPEKSLPNPTR